MSDFILFVFIAVMFTIDKNLRDFFLHDRTLLDFLFHAVNSVVSRPNKCDPNVVVKYIGRYLGRPVIATSRIDKYDGDFVTFHYNRHEDEQYVEETIPVIEFIERLIRHIPEKHYKMIRYGGIYARHREIDKKLNRAISREKQHIYQSFDQWRTAILSSFGYNPLKCSCGATMLFLELYINHQRVSLEEMYEDVMSRSRGKRSSAWLS